MGSTSFYVIDSDPSKNLAVGAATTDQNLLNYVTAVEVPLVVFYSNALHLQWLKKIVVPGASRPQDIKFNNNVGTKILLSLNGNPLHILVIQASDGTLLYKYQTNIYGVSTHATLFDSQDNFYLGRANYYAIYKFNANSATISTIWDLDLPGRFLYTMKFGINENQLFAAGKNSWFKPSLTRIVASTATVEYSFYEQGSGQYTSSNDYSFRGMSTYLGSPNSYFHFCVHSNQDTALVFYMLDDQVPPAFSSFYYRNALYGNMKCADTLSTASNQLYNLVASPTYALLMKVQFSPDQILVTELYLPGGGGTIIGATFISQTEGYYIGQTFNLFFGQIVGFIMDYQPSLSCETLILTEQDQTTFQQPSTVTTGTQINANPLATLTITDFIPGYEDPYDYFDYFDQLSHCTNAPYTIQPSAITNQVYIPGTPQLDFYFTDFTLVDTCSDFSSFTYQLFYQSGTTYTQTLPAFVTFDPTLKKISVVSSNSAFIGVHLFKVRGLLPNNQRKYSSFTIDIHDCSISTPTPPVLLIQDTYTIKDPYKSIIFTDFIPTDVKCVPLTYTATQTNGVTPIDGTLFTFNGANKELRIYTVDLLKMNLYQILVTATLGTSGLFQTGTMVIEINVLKHCNDMIVTSFPISNQVYSLFSGKIVFSFTDWTDDIGTCGPFLYQAYLTSLSALPNFFTFDSSTRTFGIDSTDFQARGTYSIRLFGQSASYPLAQVRTIDFIVQVQCVLNRLRIEKYVFNTEYTVGMHPKHFKGNVAQQIPACGFPVTSTPHLTDIFPLPNFLQFYPESNSFTLHSILESDKGTYTIKVWNQVTDDIGKIIREQYNFKIKIKVNKGGPTFKDAIENQQIGYNSIFVFQLPVAIDPDNDKIIYEYEGPDFIQLSTSQLFMFPVDKNIGIHAIKITLVDVNDFPKRNKYEFVVLVMDYIVPTFIPKLKYPESKYLTAKITSIDHFGLVKVIFSEEMVVPQNLSQINNETLKLHLKIGEYSDPQNLTFYWVISEFTNNYIKLNLFFDQPKYVSAYEVIMYLKVLGQRIFTN